MEDFHMIKDSVQNTAVYRGIHPGVEKALETIASGEYLKWDAGRHDVEGDELFCLIQDYNTKSEGKLEAHNKYIDIQVVIRGNERIAYAERSVLTADGDFNDESDIGFFGGSGDPVFLREGDFAVFFPGDAHAPGLTAKGESSRVRKAVFKIAKIYSPITAL